MKDDKFVPRSDIIIEGNQAKWNILHVGAINGTYTGQFVFRCTLTPSQKIAANRDYREMLGPSPTFADEHVSFMAYALTQLKYRIVSAPPFWTSSQQLTGIDGDLEDEDVIEKVLDAAVHAQLKYKKQLEQEKKDAIEKAKAAAQRMLDNQSEDDLDEEEDFPDEE
jgi:hypothetical protein